jgi:hypothetical protein
MPPPLVARTPSPAHDTDSLGDDELIWDYQNGIKQEPVELAPLSMGMMRQMQYVPHLIEYLRHMPAGHAAYSTDQVVDTIRKVVRDSWHRGQALGLDDETMGELRQQFIDLSKWTAWSQNNGEKYWALPGDEHDDWETHYPIDL